MYELYDELIDIEARLKNLDAKIRQICRQNETCRRILTILGVGRLTASAIVAAVPNANELKNGRHMPAWLGLVPRQSSSGGKQILLGISKRGDRYFNRVSSESSREETDSPTASDALQAAESKLDTQWLAIEDDGERFTAFRALPQKMKDKLVTYYVAQSLQIGVRGTNTAQDALVDMLSVDFTCYWQPTKDNYLSRLSKPLLLATFAPLRHKDWAAMYGDMKKSAVVESIQKWFTSTSKSHNDNAATWMPQEF